MKRFHFPLERVRTWRAGQATIEELKLEQAQTRLAAMTEEKRKVETERTQSERLVLGQATVEPAELRSLDAYRLHARARINDLENRARAAEVEVEQQRQRVIEARRQAELLERLKQKALDNWTAASNREQENLAGELYLAKRGRER